MSHGILLAIDTTDLNIASDLISNCRDYIAGYKIGMEFWNRHGSMGVHKIQNKFSDLKIFLDLKLHDIPNTVAAGIRELISLNPSFTTIHASGGPAMIKSAKQVVIDNSSETKVIAVTLLTSLDDNDLRAIGIFNDSQEQVLRLTEMALNNGADGVVASANEASLLRKKFGDDFIIITPGIRSITDDHGDQKRVVTPKDAVLAGSTYLVIGRSISDAEDTRQKALLIKQEITDLF